MGCNEWKEVTLEEVVDILGDGLHGTPKYDENGEYYFINGNNLMGKIAVDEKTKKVGKEQYIKYKKELNDRTILVSINGTLGNVAVYNGEKVILGKSACYFNVKKEYNKEFVKYIMLSNIFKNYINTYATGTTIKNMGLKQMRAFKFNIPILNEQKRISDILIALDNKIELNNEMNKTLEEMAQALFKRWFVDFEFPNEEGNPYKSSGGEMIESELGMIPKGWNISTLNDVCMKITDGSHYSPKNCVDGIYPMLSVKDMQDYCFDYKSCKKIGEEDFKKMLNSDCVPKVNDIVIAKDGSYLKHVFIINKDKKEAILSSIAIFRANVEKIYPEVLLWLLKNPLLQKIVKENYVSGSALPRIVLKDFRRLKIVVPPLEVQKSIVNLFLEIRKQIDINTENNKNLSDIRNILLPKLMSGEIRVDNVETDI